LLNDRTGKDDAPMIDDDHCDFLHEDYCIFDNKCKFQKEIIQQGQLQTFPGCSASSKDIWKKKGL
jgi:hypothetical protein